MRKLLLLPLLLLAACSGPIDPAGTWESTPESMAAAIEETLPDDGEAAAFARARFAELRRQAQSWRVTLALARDQTFRLTMIKPLVPTPDTKTGTWERRPDGIWLSTTHEQGQALAAQAALVAVLEDGRLWLQVSPGAPRFPLHKRD